MKTTRLEAFSDAVIAIILTIMVLDLKAPHECSPNALLKLLPNFFCYILSFVIIAIYWVNHHHLIHLAQKVDAPVLWANVHLLFWMTLIPWTTAYLGESCAIPLAVALYGIVALACSASFHLLRAAIARHHRADADLVKLHRSIRRKNLMVIVVYAISIPLAWVSVPLALALIALPALLYFLPDRRIEQHHNGQS